MRKIFKKSRNDTKMSLCTISAKILLLSNLDHIIFVVILIFLSFSVSNLRSKQNIEHAVLQNVHFSLLSTMNVTIWQNFCLNWSILWLNCLTILTTLALLNQHAGLVSSSSAQNSQIWVGYRVFRVPVPLLDISYTRVIHRELKFVMKYTWHSNMILAKI